MLCAIKGRRQEIATYKGRHRYIYIYVSGSPSISLNLSHLLYRIWQYLHDSHKISYIISTESNELIYVTITIPDLLEIYFQKKDNCSEIARKYRRKYGRREGPTNASFLVKFMKLLALLKSQNMCTPENMAAMAESSQELNISHTSLSRIYAKRFQYDGLQNSIGLRVEAT